jgi:hypothetical protein
VPHATHVIVNFHEKTYYSLSWELPYFSHINNSCYCLLKAMKRHLAFFLVVENKELLSN